MKSVFLLLFFIVTTDIVSAQDCNCQEDFEFVVNYYEENLPGFMDNVTESNREDYIELKNELFDLSQVYCKDQDLCFKTLLIYVEFFKDNHSSIYANGSVNVDESNAEEVNQFLLSESFKRCEIVKDYISTSGNPIKEIENTYRTKDAAYTVAIVKNENTFRDYVGIITDSKTPLWQQVQVKFELKKVGEDTYDMFLYMRDHSLRYYKNVKLVDGVLNDSWYNVNLDELKSYNIDIASNGLTFEELSEEVNYMYLPTFDGSWYDDISRFYQKHDATIKAKSYLIIDVRNNGGGSDACASHLLQYMYTKPFQSDEVEVFATVENIRKSSEWYEEMKEDTLNFSRDFLEGFAEEIATMRSEPSFQEAQEN